MATFEMSCATDVGAVRKTNQDSVAVFPQMNLVVLADGMGGHNAGEIASRKAIEVVRDAVRDGVGLERAITRANSEVYRLASQNEAYLGMGTTMVAVRYTNSIVTVANIGDSRFYRYRNKTLEQLTSDQTVAQEMRNHNLEEYHGKHISSFEHVLTNALGIQPECDVVMTEEEMIPGDIHILCSDGLSGILGDEFIGSTLARHSGRLEGTVQSLMSSALKSLAPDNVSIAMVESLRKTSNKSKRDAS